MDVGPKVFEHGRERETGGELLLRLLLLSVVRRQQLFLPLLQLLALVEGHMSVCLAVITLFRTW